MTRSMRISAEGQLAGFAGGFLLLEQIDQIDRRVKAHPLVVLGNAGHPERGCQMRLAGPGAANEHHVVACSVKDRSASSMIRP